MNTHEQKLNDLSATDVGRLLAALDAAVEALGAHTTIRQVMALLVVARSNKAGAPVGVRDIDRELGDLSSGSASKLLRSMMHVETERKPGVANTIISVRDASDLRRWDLFLSPKGIDAVIAILAAMKGDSQ